MVEINTIEKLHESDGVTACTASPTVEDLLLGVDRKPIFAAALGAGAAALALTVSI
jgi:hypothetical protein